MNIDLSQGNTEGNEIEADENKHSRRSSPRLINPASCMNGSIGETYPQAPADKHMAWSLTACQRIEMLEKKLVSVESKIEEILNILRENRTGEGRRRKGELQQGTTYL